MSLTDLAKQKPIVLHIGDPVKWNLKQYDQFAQDFTVIRPEVEEREPECFKKALQDKKWGEFNAIFRPFWNTGGEMGDWDEELINLLPKSCTIFASAGAGFDWVDVELMADRGIIYCNSAAASSESVADFAIYLILSTFRNLNWCTIAARGSPEDFRQCHRDTAAQSHNPRGHTLGIIGLGNIGCLIAHKAMLAFGLRIVYHDIVRKLPVQEAELQATFYGNLDEMLAISDCVVLATPAAPRGRQMIDAQRLQKFKKGSRFVNIARGSLVDEEAVADALDSGILVSAGLDVHSKEPYVNERLKDMRSVTLTSHNAGGTLETHIGFEELSMRNIDLALKGHQPLTPVNMHLMLDQKRLL